MADRHNLLVYFSDFFRVSRRSLENYGAFDISLIGDLPLFIDPFLLFYSTKPEYKELHNSILKYLAFLRDNSKYDLDEERIKSLYYFKEVKQNYLGFSEFGNEGHGLGKQFASSLRLNLYRLLDSFGRESVTKSSHLEKLCLLSPGVGRDGISDFTTVLIKDYLCHYTEQYAKANIDKRFLAPYAVNKAEFDYIRGSWVSRAYTLPLFNDSFVLLTPKDILTREETWINRPDYIDNIYNIVTCSPNDQLRSELDAYLRDMLSKKKEAKPRATELTQIELNKSYLDFTKSHPELVDLYIRSKEDQGERAIEQSSCFVAESERLFIVESGNLIQHLHDKTLFYMLGTQTKSEALKRIQYLKDAIENQGCWKILYKDGEPIGNEDDIHVMFKLVWFGTKLDVSSEVNDGFGPADFKISRGLDKTIVEFKLARNSQLKRNLQNQLELYKKASHAQAGYKVIIFFNDKELSQLNETLKELGMTFDPNIILIDARKKISASKA